MAWTTLLTAAGLLVASPLMAVEARRSQPGQSASVGVGGPPEPEGAT
ncbi:hypothetical protein V3N99_01035 [Dermatophilaceae bacterium Soc4.6]